MQYCIGRRFHLKNANSALNRTKVFAESWPEGETRKNRKTLLTVRKSQNQARGVSPQAMKKKKQGEKGDQDKVDPFKEFFSTQKRLDQKQTTLELQPSTIRSIRTENKVLN